VQAQGWVNEESKGRLKAMDKDRIVREHLLKLLRGGEAHADFDSVIEDFPLEKINERVTGIPYSAWDVVEHIRIAQWDILEFSRNPNHVSPSWPEGYWPMKAAKATKLQWQESSAQIRSDRKEMEQIVEDQGIDLYSPIPHGSGQTLLREVLLVADHNAYHLGALVVLKRILSGGE
jgi:hypothetical protein